MKRIILDCSVTIAWCFKDETNAYADKVLDNLCQTEALVPSIWPLEVANVLLVAERRKRLRETDFSRLVGLLRSLPITVDPQTSHYAFTDTLKLARDLKLSSYDAAYLELAMRERIPLATTDRSLRQAAKKVGVAMVK